MHTDAGYALRTVEKLIKDNLKIITYAHINLVALRISLEQFENIVLQSIKQKVTDEPAKRSLKRVNLSFRNKILSDFTKNSIEYKKAQKNIDNMTLKPLPEEVIAEILFDKVFSRQGNIPQEYKKKLINQIEQGLKRAQNSDDKIFSLAIPMMTRRPRMNSALKCRSAAPDLGDISVLVKLGSLSKSINKVLLDYEIPVKFITHPIADVNRYRGIFRTLPKDVSSFQDGLQQYIKKLELEDYVKLTKYDDMIEILQKNVDENIVQKRESFYNEYVSSYSKYIDDIDYDCKKFSEISSQIGNINHPDAEKLKSLSNSLLFSINHESVEKYAIENNLNHFDFSSAMLIYVATGENVFDKYNINYVHHEKHIQDIKKEIFRETVNGTFVYQASYKANSKAHGIGDIESFFYPEDLRGSIHKKDLETMSSPVQYCFNPNTDRSGLASWHSSAFIHQSGNKRSSLRLGLATELEHNNYIPVMLKETDEALFYISPEIMKKENINTEERKIISDALLKKIMDDVRFL